MHIKAFIDRYTLTWYTINTSNKNEVLDCGRGNDVGRCQTQVMQSVQRNGEYNCELVTFDSSYGETA